MDQVQCVLAGDVTYNIILIIMAQHIAAKLLAPSYCNSVSFAVSGPNHLMRHLPQYSLLTCFFTSCKIFFSFTLRNYFLQVGGFSALVTSAPFAPLRIDPPY